MRSQCSAQSGGWLVPCDQELLLLMINRVGDPAPEVGGGGRGALLRLPPT